jgi:hypothetical protein
MVKIDKDLNLSDAFLYEILKQADFGPNALNSSFKANDAT